MSPHPAGSAHIFFSYRRLRAPNPMHYPVLKSNGAVSPLNYTTIPGDECIVIVDVGRILSRLITEPLAIRVK